MRFCVLGVCLSACAELLALVMEPTQNEFSTNFDVT